MSSFERFNCSICLDFLSACKLTLATNCGHVFHKECLEQSLAIKPKCPSCRQAFSKARKVILPAVKSEKPELQTELAEAHKRLEELLKENEDLKAKKTPSTTLIRNENGEYIMRSRTFMRSLQNYNFSFSNEELDSE